MKRLLLLLLFSIPALADTISFSTTGFFQCGQSLTCAFNGNSVTVGTGPNTTTFSFTGVSQSFDYFDFNPYVTDFGTFTVTSTGTGVDFPLPINDSPNNYVQLVMTLTQTLPKPGVTMIRFKFYTGSLFVYASGQVRELPGTPQYGTIVYVFEDGVHGFVAAIPEPSTFALLSTGLVFLRKGGSIVPSRKRLG